MRAEERIRAVSSGVLKMKKEQLQVQPMLLHF